MVYREEFKTRACDFDRGGAFGDGAVLAAAPETFESGRAAPLRRSDTGFKGHARDTKYLDFAREALPEGFPAGPRELRVKYVKPVREGDAVLARYSFAGGAHWVAVTVDGETRAIARCECARADGGMSDGAL